MKRVIAALATAMMVSAGAGAAIAGASGQPEVDEANASIQLPATNFTSTGCAGEDGVKYVTFRGAWKGGETDLTPGSTDYSLSGPLTITNVVWTVNLSTLRGVLHGVATLSSPTAGAPFKTYAGPITLVTQGLPQSTSNSTVPARGWIAAHTYTNGTADGGSLLANVELQIAPGFAANGEFGNGSMGFPDFSVTTNNQTC
jgi:hypothetical protein